jgi:hypothetical protein
MQTEGKEKAIILTLNDYKVVVAEKISNLDFEKVRNDVDIFLEDKNELKLLNRDLILDILKN